MTRNTHDMELDHFGVATDAQLASGTPSTGDAPLSNGDGTRTWGPASGGGGITPNVIYAECNSPNPTGGDNPIPWDTYYDQDQNVISGGTLTAALAAIDLTVSGNQFNATAPGFYGLVLSFDPRTAPGPQLNRVGFVTSGYLADPKVIWGSGSTEHNPPERSVQELSLMVYLKTGNVFLGVAEAFFTVTDGVIDYAAMSITKLL